MEGGGAGRRKGGQLTASAGPAGPADCNMFLPFDLLASPGGSVSPGAQAGHSRSLSKGSGLSPRRSLSKGLWFSQA
jgi:hypothetical protein